MLFTIAMRSVLTPSSVIYFYFANRMVLASSCALFDWDYFYFWASIIASATPDKFVLRGFLMGLSCWSSRSSVYILSSRFFGLMSIRSSLPRKLSFFFWGTSSWTDNLSFSSLAIDNFSFYTFYPSEGLWKSVWKVGVAFIGSR
jgi:hypothetical protein